MSSINSISYNKNLCEENFKAPIKKPSTVIPQPFFAKDGTIWLLRQKPLIRNLVIQGGGVKVAVLPVFIKALDRGIPFLKSLDEVVGSSAGAMMSYLLASGLSLEEINYYLDNSNILNEMRGQADDQHMLGLGILTAGNLLRTLKKMSTNSVVAYWEANKENPKVAKKLEALRAEEANAYYVDQFKKRALGGFKEGVTFKDLEILHSIEPEKFKKLVVTGYNNGSKLTEYYDAENYPNMFCLDAIRISIAIPGVVKPLIVNGVRKSDGGQRDNTPIGIFSRRPNFDPYETFVIMFDRNGAGNKILHHPTVPLFSRTNSAYRFLKKLIFRVFLAAIRAFVTFIKIMTSPFRSQDKKIIVEMKVPLENISEQFIHGYTIPFYRVFILGEQYLLDKQKEHREIYRMSSHVFSVPSVGLSSLSFNAKREVIEKAKKVAELKAKEYVEIHRDSGALKSYSNLEEAIHSLTQIELDAISGLEIDPSWSENERQFYLAVKKIIR